MNTEKLHKDYGVPMSEWISLIPNELPRDAVGMFQIVPAGRDGFLFTGLELVEFVRRGIDALLKAGAVPARGKRGSDYEWIHQKQYGATNNEITESIIAEWLSMPDDPLVLCGEGVWFARPDPAFPMYVKLD
jgi:hypothetical protein